jgi:hypothetical protein
MDHEVDVVEQYPFRLLVAFDMSRTQPGFLQALLDFV